MPVSHINHVVCLVSLCCVFIKKWSFKVKNFFWTWNKISEKMKVSRENYARCAVNLDMPEHGLHSRSNGNEPKFYFFYFPKNAPLFWYLIWILRTTENIDNKLTIFWNFEKFRNSTCVCCWKWCWNISFPRVFWSFLLS